MRVLFAGEDLHVMMPAGHFIVRASGTIDWLTDFFGLGEDEHVAAVCSLPL